MTLVEITGIDGASVRQSIEEQLTRVATDFIGPTAPADPVLGTTWADNSGTNSIRIKKWSGRSWLLVYALDLAANRIVPPEVPYDIPFSAGFDEQGEAQELETRAYGSIILARTLTPEGIVMALDSLPVGSPLVIDVLTRRAGGRARSIFQRRPSIPPEGPAFKGSLRPATRLPSGSILDFTVHAVGSTTPGSGLRVAIRGRA